MKVETFLKAGLVMSLMLLIYALSAQTATDSRALSNRFVPLYYKVIEVCDFLPDDIRSELFNRPGHYVRKLAHFMIYAILGSLILITLWKTPIWQAVSPLLSLSICIIYAMTDEWHQYYIAGRGMQLIDVVIDSMGALVGIFISTTWQCILQCSKDKKKTINKNF